MLKKNSSWKKRKLIRSSGVSKKKSSLEKKITCVRSSSKSRSEKNPIKSCFGVKISRFELVFRKLHRDSVERGKNLYQNTFYGTYHVFNPENQKNTCLVVFALVSNIVTVSVVVTVTVVVMSVSTVIVNVVTIVRPFVVIVIVIASVVTVVRPFVVIVVVALVVVLVVTFVNSSSNLNFNLSKPLNIMYNAFYNFLIMLNNIDLSVESIAKAPLCLSNPSIITSNSLSCYQSPFAFFVTLLPFISLQNRAEVVVLGLLRQQQTPRKGKNRLLIFFKTIYSKSITETINTKKINILSLRSRPIKYHAIKWKSVGSNILTVEITAGMSNKDLLKVAGDVETNPGPHPRSSDRILISLNCRGLKKETKFRQLLNRIHKCLGIF